MLVTENSLILLNGSDHGEKLTDIDDAYLADTLIVAKQIAAALGSENYNILQVSSF